MIETAVASDRELRELVAAELAVLRSLIAGRDAAEEEHALAELRDTQTVRGPLDELQDAFGLSDFERGILLLACGPELVGDVARELLEHTGRSRVSFGAALATLPGPHWDALPHDAPLRRWDLVRLAEPDDPLQSPLVPDERVLHRIAGVETMDEQLERLSQAVPPPWRLPARYAAVADELTRSWALSGPVVLRGPQRGTTLAIAAAGCVALGLRPRLVSGADLPASSPDLVVLLRRMVRETVLGRVAWIVEGERMPGGAASALGRILAGSDAPIVVVESTRSRAETTNGPALPVLVVPRLTASERRDLLGATLELAGVEVPAAEVEASAIAFDLSLPDVQTVAREVAEGEALWSACRRRPRADVGGLARVREPDAGWERLVLPEPQLAQLHALAATVRHRATVLDTWGFASGSARGRGTVALFAGDSGTGKTFAAEVIAHELDLDLVHIDLSQVVDKYLGETEKRLAKLFDAAEDGGMVLLFDEADALFGKRTEVKDSHDRYANVEVGYLLQRLEEFTGLAILTTNARSAIDLAFMRRLSAVVTFPYPDRAARLRMWRQTIPDGVPRAGVDLERLAEADLSGGAIAAAALQAAYLAADDGGVLRGAHLAQAIRWELAKTGRVAPAAATM